MRVIILCCLMCASTWAGAQQIYKSVDADGNLRYSDRPMPGEPSKAISLEELSTYKVPVASQQTEKKPTPSDKVPYTRFEIASPKEGENFHNTHQVEAAVSVEPALQPGDEVTMLLDGAPVTDAGSALNFSLTDVSRGAHTLNAQLTGAEGKPIKQASVTFFVHQAVAKPKSVPWSKLTPAKKK